MKEINFIDGQKIFDALGSEIRIRILSLFMENPSINLDELAKKLYISNSAVTMHIKKLEDAGILNVSHKSGIRGSQKNCTVNLDKLIVNFEKEIRSNVYKYDIDIGLYTNYHVEPTCGIATNMCTIGDFDEPKYFDYTDRIKASLIWFSSGFLEYNIPNGLKKKETLSELQISMEIASEAPGYSTFYPSDIYFYINNIQVGFWTSPGEFNNRRGTFTPSWWWENLGQYGKLKMITVNKNGTFIDGIKVSSITVSDLNINPDSKISFKISAPKDSKNPGGLSLFGRFFGDYNQGIVVKEIFE